MALPAHILDRLPAQLRKNSLIRAADSLEASSARLEWSRALLNGALPRGGVVELGVCGGQGLATSIALRACARAQEEGRAFAGQAGLCGFVDLGATLHAPAVRALGIELGRFVVVRPEARDLVRASLRMAESQIFSVLVVDTLGDPSEPSWMDLGPWVRAVRRMTLALEGTDRTVILLTHVGQRRTIPLPVMDRVELSRPNLRELEVRVTKGKNSRSDAAFRLIWAHEEAQAAQRGSRDAA
jgi:hypothetical protein